MVSPETKCTLRESGKVKDSNTGDTEEHRVEIEQQIPRRYASRNDNSLLGEKCAHRAIEVPDVCFGRHFKWRMHREQRHAEIDYLHVLHGHE